MPSDNPLDWQQDVNSTNRPASAVSDQERRAMIAALLHERESCEKRGLGDRVALIDAELARFGHGAAAPAKRAERRPGAGRSAQSR